MVRVGDDVQLAGWRVSGRRVPSGWEWQGAQSSEGATELGFLGPTLGQMQGEAARRAGEPPGQGEDPSSEGLGGDYLLAQTEPRRPASEVMRHHMDGQPSSVGGEAPRGKMVQSNVVLEVANGILDLGVAAMVGSSSRVAPSRSVMQP